MHQPKTAEEWAALHERINAYTTMWTRQAPNREAAEAMLRGTLTHWDDNTTGDETEETYQQLGRYLAQYLHGTVEWEAVLIACEAQREYVAARRGDHAMLKVNASGTVDNRNEVMEYLDGQLNVAVYAILDVAGVYR